MAAGSVKMANGEQRVQLPAVTPQAVGKHCCLAVNCAAEIGQLYGFDGVIAQLGQAAVKALPYTGVEKTVQPVHAGKGCRNTYRAVLERRSGKVGVIAIAGAQGEDSVAHGGADTLFPVQRAMDGAG